MSTFLQQLVDVRLRLRSEGGIPYSYRVLSTVRVTLTACPPRDRTKTRKGDNGGHTKGTEIMITLNSPKRDNREICGRIRNLGAMYIRSRSVVLSSPGRW